MTEPDRTPASRDATQGFPGGCEVRITNPASSYWNMRGLVCGRDRDAQTLQVALFGGDIKTCAVECVTRVR